MSQSIHQQIEELIPPGWRRSLVHAIADARKMTKLQCNSFDCREKSKEFVAAIPGKRGMASGLSLVIDHEVPIAMEGSWHPDNLNLIHAVCNIRKGSRDSLTAAKQVGEKSLALAPPSKKKKAGKWVIVAVKDADGRVRRAPDGSVVTRRLWEPNP